MTDIERRWLTLQDRRLALEAEIKEVTAAQERLRELIVDRWSVEGLSSMKIDGRTVWLARKAYARVLDRARVKEVLEAEGLGGMLTVNTNQISAWIREREAEGEPLPPSFSGVVEVFERFAIGARGR